MKILKNGFGGYASGQNPYTVDPEVSADIQQTLSRLIGWDYVAEEWRDILVDSEGRILTSTGATVALTATHSSANLLLASVVLLPTNDDRNSFTIYNNGTDPVEIMYASTAVLGQGIVILPGVLYSENAWSGEVSAISSVTGQNLRIMELE